MGSYRYDYFGPFLLVKHKMVEQPDSKKLEKVCPTNENHRHGDKVFCGVCGSELKSVEVTVKHKPEIVMVNNICFKNDLNYLSPVHAGGTEIYKDKSVLIANCYEGRPVDYEIDSNFIGVMNLPSADEMGADMEWFKNYNKKEIDEIRAEFGEERMEFGYGIVVHYS